jgi:type II secretory ATPase GspE/PulE/Tfp pilus assembly ATPase PilB-like protein
MFAEMRDRETADAAELLALREEYAPAEFDALKAAAQGMRTLKQDGIEKFLAGHTTMEEVRAASSR